MQLCPRVTLATSLHSASTFPKASPFRGHPLSTVPNAPQGPDTQTPGARTSPQLLSRVWVPPTPGRPSGRAGGLGSRAAEQISTNVVLRTRAWLSHRLGSKIKAWAGPGSQSSGEGPLLSSRSGGLAVLGFTEAESPSLCLLFSWGPSLCVSVSKPPVFGRHRPLGWRPLQCGLVLALLHLQKPYSQARSGSQRAGIETGPPFGRQFPRRCT